MNNQKVIDNAVMNLASNGSAYINDTVAVTGDFNKLQAITALTFSTLTTVNIANGADIKTDGLPIGIYYIRFTEIKLATGKALAIKTK